MQTAPVNAIPNDVLAAAHGMRPLRESGDRLHRVGENGVVAINATGDGRVEFIAWTTHVLAYVHSALGYPAYYPVRRVELKKPIAAVLMDLDGTTVRSEEFWVWIIERTVASLRRESAFHFEPADLPFVSGHSVSEHLQYAIRKYCPAATLEEARRWYTEHTHRELAEIAAGRGHVEAFTPAPGVKPFLLSLKQRGLKLGLVTSGLYEKAWPAIVAVFRQLDLGSPTDFYDAIISAGFALRPGSVGTLGELSPKPHPWLYAETARVGLGLKPEQSDHVLAIEDSGAGVCAARIAGFPTIGIGGGNILQSGTRALCAAYCETFDEIAALIA